MKKNLSVTLVLLLIVMSCSNPPYKRQELAGADAFILDSYKIKLGKFSILEMEGQYSDPLPAELLEEKPDLIDQGDVLNIAIYHPARQDMMRAVEMIGHQIGFHVIEGKIFLPDLEPIHVAHLSLEAAREKIQKAYARHIADIEVFLAYKDRKEKRVELIGQVMATSVVVDGKTRLFDVLSQARITPEANLFKSYVVRNSQLLPVDMNKLIKEGDMSQNIVMAGGDKIYIAEANSSTAMMLGEVTHRGLVNLPGGSMPLREALAKAGGIPFTGDHAYIQVIRGNIVKPKIYTLHWSQIIQLPTDSLLLMPGDIVYVAATPITEWNRFISQLFPSFTAMEWFGKGVGVAL